MLLEPRDEQQFDTFADLVGPLPHRARWAGLRRPPRRERSVLLPAMRIPDRETADDLADSLPSMMGALRWPASESRLIATAAAVFADNALVHAATAPASLLSICLAVDANDLQVVLLTPAVPPAAAADAGVYLRDLAGRSQTRLGGLYSLCALARRRGVDATLRLAVADGRFYVRSERPRYDQAGDLPAFVAAFEIHLDPAIRPFV